MSGRVNADALGKRWYKEGRKTSARMRMSWNHDLRRGAMAEPRRQEDAPEVQPVRAADLFGDLFGPWTGVSRLLDDRPGLERATRQFTDLVRAGQGNLPRHAVTAAGGLLLLGRRDEAAALVAVADETRMKDRTGLLSLPTLLALARLHLILGDLDAAAALLRGVAAWPSLGEAPDLLAESAHMAFAAGDVAVLRDLRDRAGRPQREPVPWQYLVMLEAAGVTDHLAAHQRIVADCLGSAQVWQDYVFDSQVEYPPIAAVNHYVRLTIQEMRVLDREITDRLCYYYQSRGLGLAPYLSFFGNDVFVCPLHHEKDAAR